MPNEEEAQETETTEESEARKRGLIPRGEAIRLSGVHIANFQRRIKDGVLKPVQVAGRQWFDSQEVEESRTGGEREEIALLREVVKTSREQVSDMQLHLRESLKLIRDQVDSLCDRYQKENDALRTREAQHQSEKVELFTLYKTLVSEQHERELDSLREKAKEKRIDDSLDQLWKLVPRLGEQIAGTHKVGRFLRSLKKEQLAFVLEDAPDGFLSKEQRDMLRDALSKFDEKEPATKENANGKRDTTPEA